MSVIVSICSVVLDHRLTFKYNLCRYENLNQGRTFLSSQASGSKCDEVLLLRLIQATTFASFRELSNLVYVTNETVGIRSQS